MMNDMMPGMMLAMGFIGLLVVIVLILGLQHWASTCFPDARQTDNEQIRDPTAAHLRISIFRTRCPRRRIPRPAGFPGLRAVPLAGAGPEHDGAESRRSLGTAGWRISELRALLRGAQIIGSYLGRPVARRMVDQSERHGAGQRHAVRGLSSRRPPNAERRSRRHNRVA
jgi:hypothetical protein